MENRRNIFMPVRIDNRTDYKRNHYVPECYLKNFTFDGKRCWILRDGRMFTNIISTIAYEYYLNSRDYETFLGDNYEKTYSDCMEKIEVPPFIQTTISQS